MHKDRIDRLKREIALDLAHILNFNGLSATHDHKIYLERQIGKYLKPTGRGGAFDRFTRDIKRLKDLFNGQGEPLPTWSHEGLKTGPSVKFFLAFGHSPIQGQAGGTIRIEQKAFLLTDKVLAGVMLHEATHFLLGTKDHKYDNCFVPNHNRVKTLEDSKCYENADNWRIFYQKMRTYIRKR